MRFFILFLIPFSVLSCSDNSNVLIEPTFTSNQKVIIQHYSKMTIVRIEQDWWDHLMYKIYYRDLNDPKPQNLGKARWICSVSSNSVYKCSIQSVNVIPNSGIADPKYFFHVYKDSTCLKEAKVAHPPPIVCMLGEKWKFDYVPTRLKYR